MTKKEKEILKLAQKWANEFYDPKDGPRDIKNIYLYEYIQRTQCGRALLKILQSDKS